ncbi:50S ribosomal protein L4 [Candidatus Falkowbacteria bacterium]|nr:50S ribosomal protein L4 [Candidatus Falkowbacteria bacterium]
MAEEKIYNQKGEEAGAIKLAGDIFGVKANEALIHQAVVAQMANERQVLADTKGRSEVRGGGRKPWKQKGTGRARHGSIRSPQWRGGGVIFGPLSTRNFSQKINKKMKQKAIFMVFSDKLKNDCLIILDKIEMPEFKTKIFESMIKNTEKILAKDKSKTNKKNKTKRSILVINDKKDDKVKYSGRNLPGAEIINLDNINIIDLLKYKNLILTVSGVKKLEERYKQ